MHRLFVALRPPATIRAQLIDLMGGVTGARWQDDEQLHVTLRYIGAIERAVAEDVAVALEGVRGAPMTIAHAGVGMFGQHDGRASVWAGVTPREPVATLHRKIDHALVRAGLPPEGRAFHPHVTLARLGRRAGAPDAFLADHAGFATEPFRVDCFMLYESHLGPDGATYEAIARYPLGR